LNWYFQAASTVPGFTLNWPWKNSGATEFRSFALAPEYCLGQKQLGAQNDAVFSWSDFGRRWIWLGAGDSATFTSSAGVNTNDSIDTFNWTDSGPQEYNTTTFAGTYTATVTPLVSGWYSFNFTVSANVANATLALSVQTSTGYKMIHECLPGLYAQSGNMSKMRIISASVMLSNRAATLSDAGTAAGFYLPTGEDIMSYVGTLVDPISSLSSLAISAEFPLKKGIHGIHKPDGADCMKFQYGFNLTGSSYDGTTVAGPAPPGGIVVLAYRSPATTTNTYPGNSFLLSAFFGVEFLPIV